MKHFASSSNRSWLRIKMDTFEHAQHHCFTANIGIAYFSKFLLWKTNIFQLPQANGGGAVEKAHLLLVSAAKKTKSLLSIFFKQMFVKSKLLGTNFLKIGTLNC